MPRQESKGLDADTAKLAGAFAFKLPSDESEALNMRTIIKSDKMMKTLLYYAGMEKLFESQNAGTIKNLMMEMLISSDGIGREQAVMTLRNNAPKRIEVATGDDGSFSEDE